METGAGLNRLQACWSPLILVLWIKKVFRRGLESGSDERWNQSGMIFCGMGRKSKSLQKIHAYRWKYRTWTLLLCPNRNFQNNQNTTIAMLNLLGNTLIQSPCPKYGSGRNRCVESGLAIDASPVQINTAWLRWLIDGRANQFAKKTNGFCWSRNSKIWDKEVKHRWLLG